jgi:hypothetical protein
MAYSPYAPPRDVPQGPGTFRPLGWKTTASSIAIIATVVLGISVLVMTLASPMPANPENVNLVMLAVVGLTSLVLQLATLAACIFFLLWVHQAATNARGYGHAGLEFTPGWCVGWWFIPIASLWKPYQALKEVWLASDPSTVGSGDSMVWRHGSVPSTFPLWWTAYILSGMVGLAGGTWSAVAQIQKTDTSMATVVTLGAQLFNIVAAVAIVSIMRQLDRRQTECAARCASAPATVVASAASGSPPAAW